MERYRTKRKAQNFCAEMLSSEAEGCLVECRCPWLSIDEDCERLSVSGRRNLPVFFWTV